MTDVTKDARGFVEGIIQFVKSKGTHSTLLPKTEKILLKLSVTDQLQKTAYIQSAYELTPEQKQGIAQKLESLVQHPLQLNFVVDPGLIAGVRVQIGDFVVDTSFKNQLNRMGNELMQST